MSQELVRNIAMTFLPDNRSATRNGYIKKNNIRIERQTLRKMRTQSLGPNIFMDYGGRVAIYVAVTTQRLFGDKAMQNGLFFAHRSWGK